MIAKCLLQPTQITVGEHMTLDCSGPFTGGPSSAANIAPAQTLQVVPSSPQDAYKLQVLNVIQSTSQEVKATVTSYRVGKIDGMSFQLSDGHVAFQTSPISFTVASVADPSHPTQKPYGSLGPFRLAYPIWLWIALAVAVFAIIAILVWSFLRGRRRRRLRAEMEKFTTMLPAFAEFSKDARHLTRKLSAAKNETEAPEILSKLEEGFRLYLIRELRVPALQVSDRELMTAFRRSHKAIFRECEADLRRFFFEIEKCRGGVSLKDCEDLHFLARRLADRIYAIARRVGNRKGRRGQNKKAASASGEGARP